MWFCEHERIYQRFQDGLALAQEGDFLGERWNGCQPHSLYRLFKEELC